METEIYAVIIGWLLGVLSTPLGMYFTGIVERRRFTNVLKEELKEVRFRLGVTIYMLRVHLGKMDRQSLERLCFEMLSYPENPVRNEVLAKSREFLEFSDEQLVAMALAPRNPLGTKSVPRVVLPYLSAKLDAIGLLCADKQKELVNLLHYTEVFNVKSAELFEWNGRTFEVSDHNHTRAASNGDVSIEAIIGSAEKSVECIKNYFSS